MHLDIYELILFKLGMMIDTTMLCGASQRTLTLSQGHRDVRKQKHLCQASIKVLYQFEWNLVYF